MSKVIFIDIDGTLTNDEKEITDRTKEVLKKVNELGHVVVLCTGRPCDYAERFSKVIGGSKYIIYNNGAGIYDTYNKKVLFEDKIDSADVVSLYDYCTMYDVRFIMASNRTRYVNKIKHKDGSETLLTLPIDKFLEENNVIGITITTDDFDDINTIKSKINDVDTVKIISQSKILLDKNFKKIGALYIDIVNKSVSKGNAVKFLLKEFKIDIKDTIAIGDDENDISTFYECGFKVAMKNSLPCIKEIADYITEDNNNDGVAEFLEKEILK